MSELRVPTVAMNTEILCADGRSFRGRVFVPALASRHSGPMRLEEWLNEPPQFFPFLPDDADSPVLMNKREVLVIDMPAHLSRVLDCLNRPQMFLTLQDESRNHLIQKERITRVIEIPEV